MRRTGLSLLQSWKPEGGNGGSTLDEGELMRGGCEIGIKFVHLLPFTLDGFFECITFFEFSSQT